MVPLVPASSASFAANCCMVAEPPQRVSPTITAAPTGAPQDRSCHSSRRTAQASRPVAEHPPVIPELIELSVIPAGDPAFRLVRVAPARPLAGELPQVLSRGSEHPGRYHRPVIGGPVPCDRDNPRQYRCDVGPAKCAEFLRKPVTAPLNSRDARLDEQLAIRQRTLGCTRWRLYC